MQVNLDIEPLDKLINEGCTNHLSRKIQSIRKELSLKRDDDIDVIIMTNNSKTINKKAIEEKTNSKITIEDMKVLEFIEPFSKEKMRYYINVHRRE